MMSKRKYRKGERITSLDALIEQEFVYCKDKTHHYRNRRYSFQN